MRLQLHLAGAFGIEEICRFNRTGVSTEWNFPRWFPFMQMDDRVSVEEASNATPNPEATLVVINLNDNLWRSVKDTLPLYKRTMLIQTEARLGWEAGYDKCAEFDVFVNFDRSYAWHPGFVRINLPYDPSAASSHLDKRGWDAFAANWSSSKRQAFLSLAEPLMPRKNKAVLISTLHPGERYRIRLDAAKANAGWVDVYGGGWPTDLPNYRGRCASKLATLRQYKYALVFENQRAPGYITEKLLDCFVAGTVPIYWGAPDVLNYVPAETILLFDKHLISDRTQWTDTDALYASNIRHSREMVFAVFSVNQFVERLRQAFFLASKNKIAAT